MIDIEKLEKLASAFRLSIDQLKDKGAFEKDFSFNRFPSGCCGDASDLLGQYLLDAGIKTWYVCGNHIEHETDEEGYNRVQSHAWLCTEDPTVTDDYYILDITGDQFNGNGEYNCNNPCAYVGPMDSFHRLFKIESRDVHIARPLNEINGLMIYRLIDFYRQIIDNLKEYSYKY